MEGYGFYRWADGRTYRGEYNEDKKNGFGLYEWSDGRKYSGYWLNGKQHGLGIYVVPEQESVKYGLWEEGKRIKWFDKSEIEEVN